MAYRNTLQADALKLVAQGLAPATMQGVGGDLPHAPVSPPGAVDADSLS